MKTPCQSALFAIVLAVAGCTSDGSDPFKQKDGADYTLVLSPLSQEMTLGTSVEFALDITSQKYEGTVALAANNVPASWAVSFSPSNTVTLSKDNTAQVTMIVDVSTVAEATTSTIQVEATSDVGTKNVVADVTVENLLIVPLEDGTGNGTHDFSDISIPLGATVLFINYDAMVHGIHAGAADVGFPHGDPLDPAPSPGLPGETYTVDITEVGTYGFYCHEHGRRSGEGSITTIDNNEDNPAEESNN